MLSIDLAGKVALVEGGSRGIGGAITEMLCSAGAMTVFTHTGQPERQAAVEELAARVQSRGGRCKSVAMDASDASGTRALADSVAAEHGKIDILVCNVGQNVARSVEEITDEEWHRFIDINLTSAFYAVRAVMPHMLRARYGRIILIGSSAVYDGGGGAIDYAAGKAGLVGMMMYLCKNYARRGILTNTVHPCVIETELLGRRYSSREDREKLTAQIPAGRLGRPEDIAALVAYLASPFGDYICGQSFLLDGGRTLF